MNPNLISNRTLHRNSSSHSFKTSSNVSQVTLSEGVYYGELQDFIRSGKGVLLWSNGDIYFGDWQGNKMHGKGIFCFNTGINIEGHFQYDRLESLAYVHYPDKSYLKGIFHNGRLIDRALIYNSVEDIWYIKDYTSESNPIMYEGKGKPGAYDYSRYSSSTNEFLQGSRLSATSNEDFEAIKKEVWTSMKSTCLGCFEIDFETRHFGLVKDGVIFGPGLRVNGKCIEMGHYQNNQLNGNGQRIEFGARFYKGEFLDDSFNGQGVLFDWNRNKRAKGTFRSGNIIQCRSECSFTIEDFDVLNNLFEYAKPLEAKTLSHLNIRSYKSAFPAFNIITSREDSSNKEEQWTSSYQTTSIKEGLKSSALKDSIISTKTTPYLPKVNLNLDVSLNDPSLNVREIALSMEKSPENIEKALDRAKKCINYLSQKLDNYVTVPRPLSTCLETEEGSEERRFSQAFSIEVKSKFKNHSRAKSQENFHGKAAVNLSNNENETSLDTSMTNNEKKRGKKSIAEIWKETNENSRFRLTHQCHAYMGPNMENRKETELNLSQDYQILSLEHQEQSQIQQRDNVMEKKDSKRHLRSFSISNSEVNALTSRNKLPKGNSPGVNLIKGTDKENAAEPVKSPAKVSFPTDNELVEFNMLTTRGMISPGQESLGKKRRESDLPVSALRETNSNIPKNWTPRTLSIELISDSHCDLTARRLEHNNSTKGLLRPQASLVSLHKQSKIPNKENIVVSSSQKIPAEAPNVQIQYMLSHNTERHNQNSPPQNPSLDCILTQRVIKREPLSERPDETNYFMTKRQVDYIEPNAEAEIETNTVQTKRGDHEVPVGSGLQHSASQPIIQGSSKVQKAKPGNMTLFRPKSKEISQEKQNYGMDHLMLNMKMKAGHKKGQKSGVGLEGSVSSRIENNSGMSRTMSKAHLSGNSLGGSFWDKNKGSKLEGKSVKRSSSQINEQKPRIMKPEQKGSKKVNVNLPVNSKPVQSPKLVGSKSSYFTSQNSTQNLQTARSREGYLKEISVIHPGAKTQRARKELHNPTENKSNHIGDMKSQLPLTAKNPIKLELTHSKRASLGADGRKNGHVRQSSVGSALKKVLKPSGSTFSLEKTKSASGMKSKINASSRESGQYNISKQGYKEGFYKEKESPTKANKNENTQTQPQGNLEDYYPVKKTCEGCGINSPEALSKTSSPRLKSASSPKNPYYGSGRKGIHHENDEDPLLSAMKDHRDMESPDKVHFNTPLSRENSDFNPGMLLKGLNSPKAVSIFFANNTFSLSQKNIEESLMRSNGSVVEYNTLQKYSSGPKSPQTSLQEIDPMKHGQLESVNIKQVESYFGHEPSIQEEKVVGLRQKRLSIEIPADNEQTNQGNNIDLTSKKNPSFDLDISLVKTLDKIVKKPFTNSHSASLYQLASTKRKQDPSMTFGSVSKMKPVTSAFVEDSINSSSLDEQGKKQGDSSYEGKEGGTTKRKFPIGLVQNPKHIYKNNYFKQNYIKKDSQESIQGRGICNSNMMESTQSRAGFNGPSRDFEVDLQQQKQETIEEIEVPDEGIEPVICDMGLKKKLSLKEIQIMNNNNNIRPPLKPKLESETEISSSWNHSKEPSQNSGDV